MATALFFRLLDLLCEVCYLLLAAIALNMTYMILINRFNYGNSLAFCLDNFVDSFVWDVFGACGKGWEWNDCLAM